MLTSEHFVYSVLLGSLLLGSLKEMHAWIYIYITYLSYMREHVYAGIYEHVYAHIQHGYQRT